MEGAYACEFNSGSAWGIVIRIADGIFCILSERPAIADYPGGFWTYCRASKLITGVYPIDISGGLVDEEDVLIRVGDGYLGESACADGIAERVGVLHHIPPTSCQAWTPWQQEAPGGLAQGLPLHRPPTRSPGQRKSEA